MSEKDDRSKGSNTEVTPARATPPDATVVNNASRAEQAAERAKEQTNVARPESTVVSGGLPEQTPGGTKISGTVLADQVSGAGAATDEDHSDLAVGDVLKDRFVIDKIIGRGGMGVVYRARDLRKEETEDRDPYVAVKVLGEAFRRDPRMVVALQREARKAQTLAHPAIATVYDFDREGDRVYLTMEVLEGQPVDEVIEAHPKGMAADQVFEIMRGMCLGLAYAHNKNIIHSDFKPGNVFLTADDRIKILDFGIARAAPAGTMGSTDMQKFNRIKQRVEPVVGSGNDTVFDAGSLGALTPAYASCEMFEGKDPHPADDVYALALTHYELLTGKHPFAGAPAPAARDAGMVPAPIPGLPRRQWKAITRGLAFQRENRSQHASEYLGDLDPRTRLKVALAGTVVLLLGTAGFLAWDQARQIEVAKPDVPFEALAPAQQGRFTELLADSDTSLRFGQPASAFKSLEAAYELHPRNPQAVEKLEAVIARCVEMATLEPDPLVRASLLENLQHLAQRDDFLRQNLVVRDAIEDLQTLK